MAIFGASDAVGIDARQKNEVVDQIRFKEREEAPLKIAQVAFESRKTIADPRFQPRRDRIPGCHRNKVRRVGKAARRGDVARD